jgi:hypothetical protein
VSSASRRRFDTFDSIGFSDLGDMEENSSSGADDSPLHQQTSRRRTSSDYSDPSAYFARNRMNSMESYTPRRRTSSDYIGPASYFSQYTMSSTATNDEQSGEIGT